MSFENGSNSALFLQLRQCTVTESEMNWSLPQTNDKYSQSAAVNEAASIS